jgi:arylformamidase
LSAIKTTVHLGAHADAPNHYSTNAEGIATRDLTRYLGEAIVIEANVPRGERITQKHLKTNEVCERMLIRTNTFPNPEKWNSDFASYSPELIESWAKRGVKTIGIDTPSIDPETSKDLPSHAMVAKYDLSILEGLDLKGVPEGYYTLIALPLKIENADASPVRAILVADDGLAFT